LIPLKQIVLFQVIIILLPVAGYTQEIKDSIPDGTEGEMFISPVKDSTKLSWTEKRWRLFKGKLTTFKLGAGFLYKYAVFSQNGNAKKQMDSLGTPVSD
jgi:phosphate-selective porin OprO and OprP